MRTYIFAPDTNHYNMNQKSITIGIYGGLALVIFTLLIYLAGVETMANWWVGLMVFPVMIAFLVWAGKASRTLAGGYISLKDAFLAVFTAGVVMSLVSLVFNMLLYGVIDPDLGERLAEAVIVKTESMLEGFGVPDSDIDKTISQMEEDLPAQFSLLGQLKSVLSGLVMQAIIAIIIAAIIKKNPPVFAADSEIIDN